MRSLLSFCVPGSEIETICVSSIFVFFLVLFILFYFYIFLLRQHRRHRVVLEREAMSFEVVVQTN